MLLGDEKILGALDNGKGRGGLSFELYEDAGDVLRGITRNTVIYPVSAMLRGLSIGSLSFVVPRKQDMMRGIRPGSEI